MRPSLLGMRSRLKPLVWLLLGAMLPAFSPHLAQGVVLCIGDGHIAVESVQVAHHDKDAARASGLASSRLASPSVALAIEDAQRVAVDRASCTDVPIRVTRAADTCHQAVQVDAPGADALSVEWPVALLDLDLFARQLRPAFSSDEASFFSSRPLSSVVLLI